MEETSDPHVLKKTYAISIASPVLGTCDKRAGDQVGYDIPLNQKIAAEPALKLV